MENNPAPTSAPLIKDLRAALHRHESYIVPLARFVLFWDAFVCVVIDISRERKGRREGAIAMPSWRGWMMSGSSAQL